MAAKTFTLCVRDYRISLEPHCQFRHIITFADHALRHSLLKVWLNKLEVDDIKNAQNLELRGSATRGGLKTV